MLGSILRHKKFGIILLLILTSCVNATSLPVADSSHESAVKAGIVEGGSARIVLFLGRFITPGSSFSLSYHGAAEVFINGRDIGGVHTGEALAVDVPPGQYEVGSGDGPKAQNSPSFPLTVAAGQTAYLSDDVMMRPPSAGILIGGLAGGAIGGALAGAMTSQTAENYQGPMLHLHGDGQTLIQDKKIVISSLPSQ